MADFWRRKKISKGSIIVIGGLMLSSALLRIVLGADTAFAQMSKQDDSLPSSKTEQNQPDNYGDRQAMSELLKALRQREGDVERRESEIAVREKSVEIAMQEIERRLLALEEAENRLKSTLSLAEAAAENDLTQLTTVYENMKPKDAANLFGAMEPDFAAGFLARMRPDVAAKILAGLEPQAAYSISAILAGRNANTPKN